MKKVALIIALFVVSFGALAQDKKEVKQSDLKGPEYKNHKAWMHKAVETKVYSAAKANNLQGPDYKNQKPGKNSLKANKVLATTTGSEQQKLKGPAYKNYNYHTKKPN